MFDYIKGSLAQISPTRAVVEAGGIGFSLNISLTTYDDIQSSHEAKLYVYEIIREDAFTFYGFSTEEEREMFSLLLSVSGVGGNTARTILSAFTPSELMLVIDNGSTSELKSVKGIGLKTAERIIVDLKGRIKAGAGTGRLPQQSVPEDEAIRALCALGYPEAMARKAVSAAAKLSKDGLRTDDLIKQALKML